MTGQQVEILREDDPRAVELQAQGWSVEATSWGARFEYTEADRPRLEALAVVPRGWSLTERRAFAALCTSGSLQAVTVTERLADRIETEFTCVFATKRGRGLGSAVKAFSILTHAAVGHTRFGTGGASVNAASLGANMRVGYEVEPLWLTLAPPAIGQENPLATQSEH